MTKDEIKELFDAFIEYPPDSDMRYVTTVSTLLFAEQVAKRAREEVQCHHRPPCEECEALKLTKSNHV